MSPLAIHCPPEFPGLPFNARLPEIRRWALAWMHVHARADTLEDMPADADSDDVRRSLAGDGDAYRRIVQRYQQTIAQRLRRFSRDPRVIEEMVQDTFVETYFSLPRYRGDAPLEHWLHRIAVRVGYRHWKSKKPAASTVNIDDQHIAAPAQAPQDDAERLEQVLSRLSPRDRLVVTLLHLEQRTVEEVAALTGWSRTMVKVQAFRARGKLRKMLQEMESAHG